MKLYHYSKELYPVLKSKSCQVGMWTKTPFHYNDHISFFLEPIPLDLASMLNNKHVFWSKGTKLYQYTVDINEVPEEAHYRLVETPEKTKLIDQQDWDRGEEDLKFRMTLLKEIEDLEYELGYKGRGRDNLIKAIQKVDNDIRREYKELYAEYVKTNDPDLISKYAARVTHLMLFVKSQPIKYESVNRIRLK